MNSRLFSSAREARLWVGASLVLIGIYATLGVARTGVELLRDRNLLRVAVAAIGVGAFLVALWWLRRRRPGTRERWAAAGVGMVYVACLAVMERPEERLHLLEYGLVALLIFQALEERRRNGRGRGGGAGASWITSIVVTGLLGWLDEGIQYLLPSRVYDLRDVGFNLAAGVLAVSSTVLLNWARALDRASSPSR